MRQRVAPRIIFDPPYVCRGIPLFNDRGEIDFIDMVKISVRNNPVSRLGGIEARDAYAIVEFKAIDENNWALKMQYPRWVQNPKPRADEVPAGTVPKFKHQMNFRTLSPNNAQNILDIALKHVGKADPYIFGFQGSSQELPGWKNGDFRLLGNKWIVEVKIDGTNIDDPVTYKFILINHGANKHPEIISFEIYESINWIGIG